MHKTKHNKTKNCKLYKENEKKNTKNNKCNSKFYIAKN